MKAFLALFMVTGIGLLGFGSDALAEATPVKSQGDPNKKICETITPIGSRLGSKKVCATRAEWEEKRRLDREAIDRGQVGACMVQTTGSKGKASC
jgi:hypothetical protein